jgi:predicted O-methyltransferase YrrM
MGLRSKAVALGTVAGIMSRFITHRRDMVNVHQKHYLKFAFEDVSFPKLVENQPLQKLILNFAPDTYGDVSWQELVTLSSLVVHYKPLRIFEIGTFMGKTTYHLAANSPDQARVFTLDLPQAGFEETIAQNPYDMNLLHEGKRHEVGHYFKNTAYESKIKQIFCDSRSFDETPYADSMDMIFVDADHFYPSVINDTQKALRMLSKDGPGKVILWHDLRQRSDVERGILELCGRDKIRHIKDTMIGIYVS